MGNRSDRRQFFKILGGAALAPCLMRNAGAVTSGISNALGIPADQPTPASNFVPNQPVGVGKGIHPGRVVWAHDPKATNWDGPGRGHWWEGNHTNQAVVDSMMSGAIRQLAGKARDQAAWHALIQHFNQTHGNGHAGYRKGEKVTIKVNLVSCITGWEGGVDKKSWDLVRSLDEINASPHMMLALLRQLVYAAGVDDRDITLGDPLCLFPNQLVDPLRSEFPNVQFLDHDGGNASHPRTLVQYSSVPFYWSSRPTGKAQDYVPVCYAEAKYFINMANLKLHGGGGVTLCGKNHYGSLIRRPDSRDTPGYYDTHGSLAAALQGSGHYRALVDLMGHAHTGGKALLCLIDSLYAGEKGERSPRRMFNPPFNGQWSSSLLASQDQVAIDSVGLDFLWSEWDDHHHVSGVDDYLHEAALADNPPSGTFYDPDHPTNTTRLASLGVHEHWNNAQERQYSRNLGKREGIELVRVGPSAA